jgi:hypothetical protein
MDANGFDRVARRLATGITRRDAVRGLAAGAGAAAGLLLAEPGAEAGKRKKRCKKAGAFCSAHSQCCPKKTRRKCKVASNAGNSDTTCCGVTGAVCGGADDNLDAIKPHCCAGWRCSTGEIENGGRGVCQKAL